MFSGHPYMWARYRESIIHNICTGFLKLAETRTFKKISKTNVGMAGWRHWLMKYTNKWSTFHNIDTFYTTIVHPLVSSSDMLVGTISRVNGKAGCGCGLVCTKYRYDLWSCGGSLAVLIAAIILVILLVEALYIDTYRSMPCMLLPILVVALAS